MSSLESSKLIAEIVECENVCNDIQQLHATFENEVHDVIRLKGERSSQSSENWISSRL